MVGTSTETATLLDYLPSKTYCDAVLKAYFDLANWSCGLFDATAFFNEYEHWWANYAIQATQPTCKLPPFDIYFLCLMLQLLASGVYLVKFQGQSGNEATDVMYAAQASEFYHGRVDHLLFLNETGLANHISIHRVEQLIIRSNHFKNIGMVRESWIEAGRAVRIAQELGLHRDLGGQEGELEGFR